RRHTRFSRDWSSDVCSSDLMSAGDTPPNAAPQDGRGHGTGGEGHQGRIGLAGLVVGAIGVVFGDIGTSPLYTLREAFNPHYGLKIGRASWRDRVCHPRVAGA